MSHIFALRRRLETENICIFMSFSIAIKPNGAFGKQRPDCGSEILMRVLVVRNIYKTNANLSLLLFSAKPERRYETVRCGWCERFFGDIY